jgi:hypothetical protein
MVAPAPKAAGPQAGDEVVAMLAVYGPAIAESAVPGLGPLRGRYDMAGLLVIGSGKAEAWSKDASAVDPQDGDLLAAAGTGRLYIQGQKRRACDRDGNLLGEAWLLVVGDHVDESDLDRDPSVIAYCSVP